MTNSPLNPPDIPGADDIDSASASAELERSPEEKLNREQSLAPTKDEDGT